MLTKNISPQARQNKQEIKSILKRNNLRLIKRLDQNFLIDQKEIEKLIKLSDIKKSDVVIEIGAGLGNITRLMAQKAQRVIAVEKDKKMARILKNRVFSLNNVTLIPKDILNLDISKLNLKEYKVVANLPFNISFKVLQKFSESANPPKQLTLIVQKEVAQKICPSKNKNNFWSLFTNIYGKANIVGSIKKEAFWPKPKVKISIIQIKIGNGNRDKRKIDNLLGLIQVGFRQPRKQLINNFKEGLKMEKGIIKKWFNKSGISPRKRAEELSLNDWKKLSEIKRD